ncbi:LysR family transcriptional regulator [Pseudoalteromonas sp. MMG022]|uniref:LysR family transcriptional regulator n=1 Tax=Pseudoalteromonas sp. MMG022 TaxID=2909978 RepID=UPI001F30E9F7|nr:LysR family transcriptional regulator [Pseudoalteromonas sp. MMG022]MCF6437613.1 LysR family transcriptional regulator [Pseudoalteromonas sp. MMG022]
MDKLRALEMFLATCDSGSFAYAAKACKTDPSTVSKAISRLEAQLNLTLFQRSTRQLRITDSGLHYANTVRKLVQELSDVEKELRHSNDAPSGTLRISSAACYGHLYLSQILPAFCKRYPDIKLELEINDLHVDIIDNNIDIAIRTGFVKDSRLIARKLSPMDFLTCSSPLYLKEHGTPRTYQDFEHHRWIGFRIKETHQLQPIYLPNEHGEFELCELNRTHITDDGESMANMCVSAMGIAQLPHFLAKQHLENGALLSLYPHIRPPQIDSGVFAIYPKREYLPAKVRVFLDFLITTLEQQGESTQQTWAQHYENIVKF